MNRLAILVPARNAAAVIGRLFDSIDAQTSPVDEVLVYDDASEDSTPSVARARGARVIRGDVCVGPSYGKNVLARETRCEWLHFHDADDALHPHFVARARDRMRQDADVVLFATEDRQEGTNRILGRRTWDDAALLQDPVRYAIVHTITNCGIYRREPFLRAGGFDSRVETTYNEDQALHLRLARAGLRFRADPLPGVVIYRRGASMSASHRVECARAQVEVLRDTAAATGSKYAAEIGARLWRLAGELGGYSDWASVRRCLALAAAIGYRVPEQEHWAIRAGARLAPLMTIVGREIAIRVMKPALRAGMPTVSSR